jgi:hypothetical protein
MGHFQCISVDCVHTNLHIVIEVNTDINHDVFYNSADFERIYRPSLECMISQEYPVDIYWTVLLGYALPRLFDTIYDVCDTQENERRLDDEMNETVS